MVYKVGDVIIQKSSLGGALVYGGAIVMSFIGVGFSLFSLSRLQNTSGRRTVIAEVFKWYNMRPTRWSFSKFEGSWIEDVLVFAWIFHCEVLPVVFLTRIFWLSIYMYAAETGRSSSHDCMLEVIDLHPHLISSNARHWRRPDKSAPVL